MNDREHRELWGPREEQLSRTQGQGCFLGV